MTLKELSTELAELLRHGTPPDTPVVLSVGELRGLARRRIDDDPFPTSIVVFNEDLEHVELELETDSKPDECRVWLWGGPENTIPPVL